MLNYVEFPPSTALAGHVKCFWTLSGRANPVANRPEQVPPDGCIELIWNFADPYRRYREDGIAEIQPRRLVVGPMRGPVKIEPTGRVDLLGIRFYPAGAYPFFHAPLDEFAGQIPSLENAVPHLNRSSRNFLDSHTSPARRIRAIEAILLRELDSRHREDLAVTTAVRCLLETGGMLSISSLMKEFGMSGRQLERRFLRVVGLGPKLLARILRFQRVFEAAQRAEPRKWAGVAAEYGYFDQSHLIRDFLEFTGESPARYFSRESNLLHSFTSPVRPSDFSNTLE